MRHCDPKHWRCAPIALAVALSCAGALAQEPRLGDSEAAVESLLGKPSGRIQTGGQIVLNYRQGLVVIRDDRVVSVNFLSPEQTASKEAERAQRAAEWQASENNRQLHVKQGMDEKAAKKTDSSFLALPAQERLAYWKEFRERYPGVSAAEEIAVTQEEIPEGGASPTNAAAATPEDRVQQIKDRIEFLQNQRGVSRGTLIESNRELTRLREELQALEQTQTTPPPQDSIAAPPETPPTTP